MLTFLMTGEGEELWVSSGVFCEGTAAYRDRLPECRLQSKTICVRKAYERPAVPKCWSISFRRIRQKP